MRQVRGWLRTRGASTAARTGNGTMRARRQQRNHEPAVVCRRRRAGARRGSASRRCRLSWPDTASLSGPISNDGVPWRCEGVLLTLLKDRACIADGLEDSIRRVGPPVIDESEVACAGRFMYEERRAQLCPGCCCRHRATVQGRLRGAAGAGSATGRSFRGCPGGVRPGPAPVPPPWCCRGRRSRRRRLTSGR